MVAHAVAPGPRELVVNAVARVRRRASTLAGSISRPSGVHTWRSRPLSIRSRTARVEMPRARAAPVGVSQSAYAGAAVSSIVLASPVSVWP